MFLKTMLHDQDIKTLSKMEFLRCLESTPQDEYIKSKIYEANVLIDRVKNTLTDIKNKTQPRDSGIDADNKNMEDEALISHIEYDVKTTDNDEWNRPKTRRNSISPEDSVSLRSKFICKPEEMLPHDTQLAACNECIKALEDATVSERPKTRRISSRPVPTVERSEEVISRSPDDTQIAKLQEFIEDGICGQLNTITEQTESEISSTASECKEVANTMKVTKSTSQNTDTLVKDSKEVQVFMSVEVLTAGCQIMQPQSDSTTQTEKQNKHLCAENVCASQIGSTRSNHLGVQILPSVNIIHYDDGLIIQNILNFYIDGRGKTYVNKASNAKNVGFFVSKSHDTHARFQVKEYLTASTAEMQPKIKQESHIKAISSTSIKLVISDYVNDKSPEQSSSDCTIYDIKNMKQPKELAKSRSSETPSKHLVLKSFQLYDNPNVHDPGEMIPILRVSNMDTTVYKTFINPEGIPRHMSHPSVSEIPSSNIVSPEILRKISSFRFYQPRKHHASTDYKASTQSSEKQYSKLVDVGLYTSKSTQCQLNFSNQFDDELTEADKACKEVSADKSSYEKISITISYSTEETISGDSYSSKEIKPERSDKQEKEITVHEPDISTGPLNKLEVIESFIGTLRRNTNAKLQSTTSPRNTFKTIRTKLHDMNPELVVSELSEPDIDSMSTDSTVPHFISGLTTTTSSEIKKVIPHIRKSVVKDKGKPSTSKNDYTVLPVQVHGDCIPNDYILKSKYFDFSKNSRHKDEENLFCETSVPRPLGNSYLKRRVLRYKPNNYVKTYYLDSSKSDILTLEDPDYKASSRSSEKQYSKLVDVGLYTSKSTQCQLNFSNQFDDELTKEDLSCKEVIADKSSYEKISITISYSTEETISGESSSSKEIKPERSSKQEKEITVHEPEIISTRPLNKSEVIESYIGTRRQNTNAKPQSTTSPRNTFKSIRSKLQDMNPELVVSGLCEPELDTISTDSTVLHFISGLTTTTSSDIKKVLPHIRKSLVKDKGTPTTSKNDYTALPVQVHGDCIPDDYIIKTKHLDLAKNGRYKDEENLFCETFVPRSLENSSPKRRALRYKPNNYVNTHLLDLSNSGTLTLEDPGISEGEIKCKSTTSLGEVHKCNSLNPIDGRLPSAIKNYSTDPNVTIRQKRSYFNHWVTYYINKNTHNSSSSSKN